MIRALLLLFLCGAVMFAGVVALGIELASAVREDGDYELPAEQSEGE